MRRHSLFIALALALSFVAAAVSADVVAARATVTVKPTVLVTGSTSHYGPTDAVVINRCAASVYLGGSTVTITTGLQLDPGQSASLTLGPGISLYGVVAAATCRVDTLKD